MNQPQTPLSALHLIVDRQHDTVVSSFEYPNTWQAQSRVDWNFQNVSFPLTAYAAAFNPNGTESIEFLPAEAFFWIEPNYGFNQEGQNSMGMVCLRPMPAADAMMRWVLPKYRGNRQNLQVVGTKPMPDLPDLSGLNLQGAPAESIAVRIEYMENGRMFEEEFYGVKVQQQCPPSYGAAGTLIQTNWGFARLFCFRAEKGTLEAHRQNFWQIIRSIKTNPQWEQLYNQILQQLKTQFDQYIQAGYDQINAATQLSRQISAQNEAWLQQQQQRREADWQSWEQKRGQEQDAWGKYTTNDAFGDYIMGQESYEDPYWQYGSQHSGYHEYVWTDKQGNYQYSDDANFDPNINASTDWVLMKKKQIGQ